MTYRNDEDALRARIRALESKLSQRAQERSELQQELAHARQDLAALHPPQEQRPTTLLVLGVVGAALILVGLAALYLAPLVGYHAWVTQLPFGVGDLGLGLGLIGFNRVTRQRLMLAAAILLFVGALETLIRQFAYVDWLIYPGWLTNLAQNIVLGVALLRVPEGQLRRWKSQLSGVLFLVGVLFSALSFTLFFAQARLGVSSSEVVDLFRYISIPHSLVTAGKMVVLVLCLLELRSPATR